MDNRPNDPNVELKAKDVNSGYTVSVHSGKTCIRVICKMHDGGVAYATTAPIFCIFGMNNVHYFDNLSVPRTHRRRGLAKRLLTTMCEEWDKAKVAVLCDAVPHGGGMNKAQLLTFYRRYGFVPTVDTKYFNRNTAGIELVRPAIETT